MRREIDVTADRESESSVDRSSTRETEAGSFGAQERGFGERVLVGVALGFGIGAASVDVWMAAAFCVVGGIGNGGAVVCNALLVQRGMRDDIRGRALTFVMSATYGVMGLSVIVTGLAMPADAARWVWASGAIAIAVAAVVGYSYAREPEAAMTRAEAALR